MRIEKQSAASMNHASLKTQISQRMCKLIGSFATQQLANFSSNITPKEPKILKFLSFTGSFEKKNFCSQLVSLRKVVSERRKMQPMMSSKILLVVDTWLARGG